jgi:hypothetical protein
MAAQQPANYKVFCIVDGKTQSFSVKISPHETVDELKDAIKIKKSHEFDNFDADDLTLYLINLADDDSLLKNVTERLAGQPPLELLKPTRVLSTVFLGPPAKDLVHILVQSPSPSEFLHADLRRIASLTKPSHVVGLGDKRPASTELDDLKSPTKRRRNGPRLSDYSDDFELSQHAAGISSSGFEAPPVNQKQKVRNRPRLSGESTPSRRGSF